MMQESATSGNEKMERNAYWRHAVWEKILKGVLRICNPEEITWAARKAQGEQIPGIMMVAAKIVSCFFLRQLCLNEKRQYLHLFQIQIFPIFPDYKSGILPHLLTICINEVKRIILSLARKGGHGRLNGILVPTPPGRRCFSMESASPGRSGMLRSRHFSAWASADSANPVPY